MEPQREQWLFAFEALPGSEVPPAVRVRRLLKTALRRDGLKCVRQGESPELDRLRQLVASLSDRVAAQAELLARRAQKAAMTPTLAPAASENAKASE